VRARARARKRERERERERERHPAAIGRRVGGARVSLRARARRAPFARGARFIYLFFITFVSPAGCDGQAVYKSRREAYRRCGIPPR